MNSSNQQGNRMMFDNCKQAIIKAFLRSGDSMATAQQKVENAVLSQSFLRLEQPLYANTSQLYFPVLDNQQGTQGQSARPTEQRLTLQDAFFCGSVMLYLTKIPTASIATAGNMLLNTYPNAITYPVAAAVAGGSSYNRLYNGKMSITVNREVIVPAFDLMRFNQIPQSQLTAATNPYSDMFDGTQAEFLEPNPVFIGSKGTQIQITLPEAIGTVEASSTVYAVLVFHGLLAQNVTIVS